VSVVEYIGKNVFTCEMCKVQVKEMFLWKGVITKTTLHICKKCAKRDSGKKVLDKLMENK
jgi:ribosome-binding protein aMBF1 (putative translation factor)